MCVAMDQYNNILLIFLIGLIGIWALMCISNRIQNGKLLYRQVFDIVLLFKWCNPHIRISIDEEGYIYES